MSEPRKRPAILVLIATFAFFSAPSAMAQGLSCTLTITARWTLPANRIGTIGLRSTLQKTGAQVRVERGGWMPLDDHSYGRVVRFHPDGRWEDRLKRCLDCPDLVARGAGAWRMREEVRPGCEYRRQYEFYLFVRDVATTKIVAEKRIVFPSRDRMMPRGARLIDLGDLARFF